MTLKEKFEDIENLGRFSDNGYSSWSTRVLDEQSTQCEQIADDFAKEVLRVYITNKTLQYKQSQGDYSLDELLLIIKKEKGL